MKLDISQMRYLSQDDYRVLAAVESGSRTHELVPTHLIYSMSKVNPGSAARCLGTLAKHKLVSRVRNAKYDGYRLTYNGHDYLALKAMLAKRSLAALGTTVGVGKESDIYSTKDYRGVEKILKIHRLGRTSFRTVKSKRDYLKKNGPGLSWMFLSKVAASKEHQFLSTLFENGFNVPQPYDYSRHCILMEWIKGYPMTKLYEFRDYKQLYSDLMKFIVKLANHGLIHCDFNEFNIMIRDEEEIDSGKYEDTFVVLDFPQSISIDHQDAEWYFDRDVECVKRFFERRFRYVPKRDPMMVDTDGYGEGYKYTQPSFKRDVKRVNNIDELLQASGFKRHLKSGGGKGGNVDFEDAMKAIRDQQVGDDEDDDDEDEDEQDEYDDNDEEYDEEDYDDDELDFDDDNEESDEENEKIIEALKNGVENLKMDKLGNYYLDDKA